MSDPLRERPCIHIALACIHIALAPGAEPALVRAVEVGAEEEGVPCRVASAGAGDLIAIAYEAALGSRFGIGLAYDGDAIVLHEMHMPAAQPVLRFGSVLRFGFGAGAAAACRVMGANAARLLVNRPLHLGPQPEPLAEAVAPVPASAPVAVASSVPVTDADLDPTVLASVVAAVVAKLRERGIR